MKTAALYTLALAGLLLALTLSATAQAPPDQWPAPVGGMEALAAKVVYPETALKDALEGTVMVQVTITAEGKAQDAKVIKGVRQDLDEAAVKAVTATAWVPAQRQKKAVAVSVTVPILFKLDHK